ncbi:MAG TPA: NAD(P)-dependent oxidoreductase [Candidatus Eisenbacteria bacterium]
MLMRVLITGGTGFIGSGLARRLLGAGHSVRLLSLIQTPAERSNADDLVARGASLIEGTVADRSLHGAAIDGVDVVHHVAATMREADVPDRVFWDTNVSATKDLVAACRRGGARRFVYCSTMGVTGDVKGRVVDETVPYRPHDIYQRTKAAAEQWIVEECRRDALEATAVRPADVYGPGDRRLLKLFQMVGSGKFVYLGSGRGRRHMIYIDDLLDGMIAAQELPAAVGEVFLLAGPSPIRLVDLVATIAREMNVPEPRRHVPYGPVWLASVLVEAACRPLKVQPPIYPRRVNFFAHDYAFDTAKAGRALGFHPRVDVAEGVRRTIEAYRAEGLLA